jgi:hypothetical protein
MPPCISPIAPSTVLSVVMMSSPTPSHGNGNIRAYVSTSIRIRIGSDITPTHHAQDSRAEYHQQHALHDVPHACVSWVSTFSLSHNVVVNFISIMTRRTDWHACHRELGEPVAAPRRRPSEPLRLRRPASLLLWAMWDGGPSGVLLPGVDGASVTWEGYGCHPQTRHTVVHRVLQKAHRGAADRAPYERP